MHRYMKKEERGLVPPRPPLDKNSCSIEVPKTTRYLPNTNGVFLTTDSHPTLLKVEQPTFDMYPTAHNKIRAMSCKRNYTNQRWLYNKHTGGELSVRNSSVDVRRGKDLRKITRREDKLSKTQANLRYVSKSMNLKR